MDEREDFVDIAVQNGTAFLQVFEKYKEIDDFLLRECEDYIAVRSVHMDSEEIEDILEFETDTDGVVIEWRNWCHLSHKVRHLKIEPTTFDQLKYIWPLLKKHLKLNQFSEVGLKCLKYSLGMQLFYEYGWEYWIGLIPATNLRTESDRKRVRHVMETFLKNLQEDFQRRLMKEMSTGNLLQTLMKNNLSKLGKMFILPDDCFYVLNLLQESIESVTLIDEKWVKILFSFRFGEKNKEPVDIPALDKASIKSATIHIAVNISSPIDIFWSRLGLQEIIGQRGTLTPTMSLFECCSFQSNLDGRRIDVDKSLLSVCNLPSAVKFIQFYVDLPHRQTNTCPHPVSGSIIVNKSVHPNTRGFFQRNASTYLCEMDNNFSLIYKSVCRCEYVVELCEIPEQVCASNYWKMAELKLLLIEHPLLVPFETQEKYFVFHLQDIGLSLLHQLKDLHKRYCETGDCTGTWRSYSIELALEKLLWGRPSCTSSTCFSINLGPGTHYPSRSKTDMLGFLGLEEYTSCMEDENATPPLSMWSKNEIVQRQIKRVFGFNDVLYSGNVRVIGRRAVLILLQDFYEVGIKFGINYSDFILMMKKDASPPLVGSITINQLALRLTDCKHVKFPMVWKGILQSLSSIECNILDVIKGGIEELDLHYFPAFRVVDANRNRTLFWNFGFKLWSISQSGFAKNDAYSQISLMNLSQVIVQELELRRIVYSSKMKGLPCFPWLQICLKKLEPLKLEHEQRTIVLTFLTAVGLLQNNIFVDYYRLSRLEQDLPVSQYKLRTLEILSKFLLPNFNICKIWRFHHSIPHKLTVTAEASKPTETSETSELVSPPEFETPDLDDMDSSICDDPENVVRARVRHWPANTFRVWSEEEINLLVHLKKGDSSALSDIYKEYVNICKRQKIPDRSFGAFKAKFYRL